MKKTITRIITIVIVISLLGGCSGSSNRTSNYEDGVVKEGFLSASEAPSMLPAASDSVGQGIRHDSPAIASESTVAPGSTIVYRTDGTMVITTSDYQNQGSDYILPENSYETSTNVQNSNESYLQIIENENKSVSEDPLMTFSLKVDTAAYSNVQRYIQSGVTPPADAVKTEEMINFFSYDTPMEFDGISPFSVYAEVGPSVFDSDKYMAFVRVKTKDIDKNKLPSSNLTFLIDTSGSMHTYDKLPLLKEAFSLLVETLDQDDVVSIVTYAGSSGVLLDSVGGNDKTRILNAINSLSASGSTAGESGINLAYALAEKNFVRGGNNRIILATDGDFNVGTSDINELAELVSQKKESGIYLSVLGFGTGNIRDDIMETLSKNGSGNYAYINSVSTANKVLVEELSANLFVVAEDVKAQLEFNPENIGSYRLIGYENRMLRNEDFEDDTVDAGEIGIGTEVIMMFEFSMKGENNTSLKYGSNVVDKIASDVYMDELFEVRIRYKNPGESESSLLTYPVKFSEISTKNSNDFNFASSIVSFAHILRNSSYQPDMDLKEIADMAKSSKGADKGGYKQEFVDMVKEYQKIAG